MNLFFDLDGTLLDARKRYYQVYADVLRELGFDPLDWDTYWKYKRTLKTEKSILEFSKAEEVFEKYYNIRNRRMETHQYMEKDCLWPELVPILPRLSSIHHLTLVTLRMDGNALQWELEHLGIADAFFLVLHPDTGFGTPITPASKISIMRENFGQNNLKGWIVGDTDVDVITGKATGLSTAAVTFGLQDASLLEELKPDKLFHTPEELAVWLLSLKAD
jgi:phosphoglycolate phosphatase